MTDSFIKSSPETSCKQEIASCPFCGGTPELVDRPHGSCVRCPGCGAMIARDLCPEIQDTKQAVIKAWNSRTVAVKDDDNIREALCKIIENIRQYPRKQFLFKSLHSKPLVDTFKYKCVEDLLRELSELFEEIEPCSLCGYDEPDICSEGDLFYVQCSYCGTHTQLCKTQHEAVLDWNNGRAYRE